MPAEIRGFTVSPMNTFWTVVTFAVVVGIGLLAVWAFLIAPIRVPRRHG